LISPSLVFAKTWTWDDIEIEQFRVNPKTNTLNVDYYWISSDPKVEKVRKTITIRKLANVDENQLKALGFNWIKLKRFLECYIKLQIIDEQTNIDIKTDVMTCVAAKEAAAMEVPK